MGKGRSDFKMLADKYIVNRHLGRLSRRWEDNIITDLEEICVNARNWIELAQNKDYWRNLRFT